MRTRSRLRFARRHSMARNPLAGHLKLQRNGVTWVDVAVVVVIVWILISLIAPGVQGPRQSSRKLQCLNNMKQITLAVHNFSSAGNGEIPYLHDRDTNYPWTYYLLPLLDNSAFVTTLPASNPAGGDPGGTLACKVFQCPSDVNNAGRNGGLSYVANAGYGAFTQNATSAGELNGASATGHNVDTIDWNQDGVINEADAAIARDTGVFWRNSPYADNFRMSLDYIVRGDGVTGTIMISENCNAGAAGNFLSPNLMNMAFVFGAAATVGGTPIVGDAPSGTPPSNTGQELTIPAAFNAASLGVFKINFDSTGKLGPGAIPGPNSMHPSSVNVFFCDGAGRSVSSRIDPSISIRLLTPNGFAHGQTAVSDNSY